MTEATVISEPFAFVFPGQGSQFVGMGRALSESSAVAHETLRQADDILGFDLSQVMINGPAETLEDTINAQPAILAVSIGALRAFNDAAPRLTPAAVAGHSLGEFSALVAADVISFEVALRLVRERGRLMKEAGSTSPGGMAAILGLDDDQISAVCERASVDGVLVAANRNCPGQIVISGVVTALETGMALAKAAGAKRVARLGVSIASHSPLMASANASFNQLLESTTFDDPRIPVIGNVGARPIKTAEGIRSELRLQMESPVNWTGSIEHIVATGISTFVEVGPGNVLSGLIRRIDRSAAISSPASLGLGLPDNAST